MKTRNVLILCTALLLSMPPCSDAQSLKDGLKNIGDKIGKQIQSTKNQITKKTTTTKQTVCALPLMSSDTSIWFSAASTVDIT